MVFRGGARRSHLLVFIEQLLVTGKDAAQLPWKERDDRAESHQRKKGKEQGHQCDSPGVPALARAQRDA
jgi:hypothetical protein